MQFPQEQITLAAFETSVGAPPFKQFTKGRGQFGPGEIGELACDPTDQLEFRLGQRMTAKRQTITDRDWHRNATCQCRSPRLRYRNPQRKSSEIFATDLKNVQTPGAGASACLDRPGGLSYTGWRVCHLPLVKSGNCMGMLPLVTDASLSGPGELQVAASYTFISGTRSPVA